MNREELILSCQDIVKNLVKKYNNHKPDEDLQTEGMIAVIECVDRCIKDELTDIDQIQARCNKWARNRILTTVYKQKIKLVDDEDVFDSLEEPQSDSELLIAIDQVLTPRQREYFKYMLDGYSYDEIADKLQVAKSTVYKIMERIKEKILNLEV